MTIVATDVAQPVFGTTLSAAFVPTTDGLGQPMPTQVIPVVDDALPWEKNDEIIVVETDGTKSENARIVSIGAGSLTVTALKFTHASGARVILNVNMASLYIQRRAGDAGALGVGTKRDAALGTGLHLMVRLETVAAGQPVEVFNSNIFGANPGSSSEYWVVGTINDVYLPSIVQT